MDIEPIIPPTEKNIADSRSFASCYAMGKEVVGESNITPLDFRQGALSYAVITQLLQVMKFCTINSVPSLSFFLESLGLDMSIHN